MGKKLVSWKTLDQTILDAIADLESLGFTEPTIRSVYYYLGGTKEVFPLTQSYYKSLDEKLVEMRLNEQIPWGFFAVKRGRSIEGFTYIDPDRFIDMSVKLLQEAHMRYTIPRWFNQQNRMEVWVEKDGLLGAVANWLSDLDLTFRAPGGYAAWEFIHLALKDIQEKMEIEGQEVVHIFYLGDLDPSGKHIPFFMETKAIPYFKEKFGLDVEFYDLGLYPSQVVKHGLPSDPSPETIAKIKNDTRRKWYLDKYPEVYVELDAFFAVAPAAVKKLLRDVIAIGFDETDYASSRDLESMYKALIHDEIRDQVVFKNE